MGYCFIGTEIKNDFNIRGGSGSVKIKVFMSPTFEDWWKGHTVLTLFVSVCVQDGVSNYV